MEEDKIIKMINKMTKIVENNIAVIIMIALFSVVLFSSCGSTKPYHACGITELNKQYKAKCASRK